MSAVSLTSIRDAALRLAPHLVRTPCIVNPLVDDLLGVHLIAKAEHLQLTGSRCFVGQPSNFLTTDATLRHLEFAAYMGLTASFFASDVVPQIL